MFTDVQLPVRQGWGWGRGGGTHPSLHPPPLPCRTCYCTTVQFTNFVRELLVNIASGPGCRGCIKKSVQRALTVFSLVNDPFFSFLPVVHWCGIAEIFTRRRHCVHFDHSITEKFVNWGSSFLWSRLISTELSVLIRSLGHVLFI
jgi:hypothetical protein